MTKPVTSQTKIEADHHILAWDVPPLPPSIVPEQVDLDLPRLYSPGARTLARNRWEQIVTTHLIPAPVEQVWKALTDPKSLSQWLVACHGSLVLAGRDCILDFEDGDFFLCRPMEVTPPNYLEWRWRWLGIGPAWTVKWFLQEEAEGTQVTVVDEAFNPPARTGHYRGEGWPEILDLLTVYLRTGREYRWPCRSQSYILTEVAGTVYSVWDRLFNAAGLKWWLHGFAGALSPGQTISIEMGDATGMVEMNIQQVTPPSYNTYPFVTYTLQRPFWPQAVAGRLFLEPAGWGRSILQTYQTGWENLGPALQLRERSTLVGFWAEACKRAAQMCEASGQLSKVSPWVLSEYEAALPPLRSGRP